jgi:hypothetical protein
MPEKYVGQLKSRICRSGLILIISGLTLTAAQAQDRNDDTEDPHFREELGVNKYTTPSIEALFDMLGSLRPIPAKDVQRKPPALPTDNRVRIALTFGVLIADGFVTAELENAKDVDELGRELLRRARSLGVEKRMTRHSKRLLDLAKSNQWKALRRELIVTQKDVEKSMLELRDEEIVHILSLGGWIRGLEIGAAAVEHNFTPERAEKLSQLDILDYFLDRLETLNPSLKSTKLVEQITTELKGIRDLLKNPVAPAGVAEIRRRAAGLVNSIEADEIEPLPSLQ